MLEKNIILIVLAIAIMVLLFSCMVSLFRLLFSYKITSKGIQVLLFNKFPIYRIPFQKIDSIYTANFLQVALVPGLHFPTRIFKKRVVIKTNGTMFRYVFLTPKGPDGFIKDIQKELPSIEYRKW